MNQNIKNIVNLLIALIAIPAFLSCDAINDALNDDWKDEQYEKYVSFVRSGYVETFLNTNTEDGVVHYKIPIVISGSTVNNHDVTVEIEIDKDTLNAHNIAEYYKRTDLYYLLLDSQYYSFPKGKKVVIPAGKDVGMIDIDFRIGDLDLVEKYILPLKIASTSHYEPSPIKHYKKTLMRIVPFNYFSGNYSAVAASITAEGYSDITSMATREMRYVNDSTVFFYAGLCEEDASDREKYKVYARFNADGAILMHANNDSIDFTPITLETVKGVEVERCLWNVEEVMDVLQPYLMIRTLTLNIKYTYLDISNPNYEVKYTVNGYYTLERRRNTQIPEEDQQEIFD